MEALSTIIVAILGAIGTIDLGRLIFFNANKKKANAEAEGQEVATVASAVDTLKSTLDQLNQQIDKMQATNDKQEERIEALTKKNEDFRATITALFDDMCVHKGCRVRKPHQGRGSQWFEKYREDPALGADYDSIDTLLKKDRLKRLKAEAAEADESTDAVEEA